MRLVGEIDLTNGTTKKKKKGMGWGKKMEKPQHTKRRVGMLNCLHFGGQITTFKDMQDVDHWLTRQEDDGT